MNAKKLWIAALLGMLLAMSLVGEAGASGGQRAEVHNHSRCALPSVGGWIRLLQLWKIPLF